MELAIEDCMTHGKSSTSGCWQSIVNVLAEDGACDRNEIEDVIVQSAALRLLNRFIEFAFSWNGTTHDWMTGIARTINMTLQVSNKAPKYESVVQVLTEGKTAD